MNNHTKEIALSVILVVLLVVVFFPKLIFMMPNAMHMVILASLVVVFGFFSSLILHEDAHDEREGAHTMLAGRAGFLTGSILLLCGIVFQSLNHMLDRWLVFTLVAMVVAKIVARMYSDRNN